MNQPFCMWLYWRDKKGVAEALEDYYQDVLRANPGLFQALVQYHAAEALINNIMSDMLDQEEDYD